MSQSAPELWFVFDPLCGWCYAAHPVLRTLQAELGWAMRFLPAGLFAGEGARPLNATFRDYAWGHDQRIQQLTGQVFSEIYYRQVLSDFSKPLDSGSATLAFYLLSRSSPGREVELLHRIQTLRYVDGQDVTSPDILATLAPEFGMDMSRFLAAFAADSAERADAHADIAATRHLMQRLNLRGVPDLLLHQNGRLDVLPSNALYSNGQELVKALRQASAA